MELIERLRLGEGTSPDHLLLLEAAFALESLQAENQALREKLAGAIRSCEVAGADPEHALDEQIFMWKDRAEAAEVENQALSAKLALAAEDAAGLEELVRDAEARARQAAEALSELVDAVDGTDDMDEMDGQAFELAMGRLERATEAARALPIEVK